MRFASLLPLAALSAAFVIPDERVMNQVSIEESHRGHKSDKPCPDKLASKAEKSYTSALSIVEHAFSDAKEHIGDAFDAATEKLEEQYFDIMVEGSSHHGSPDHEYSDEGPSEHGPPGHGPPGRGPPEHGRPEHGPPGRGPPDHEHENEGPPEHGSPKHGRPGRGPPGHGPPDDKSPDHDHPPHKGHGGHGRHGHHGKPNQTVYELIFKSKYTTKLAKLISEFDDLVELLNGTTANFTVFAPTDRAFDKIPEHAPKPSKEFLKLLLSYHVSPHFYPAGRVLKSQTIPTLLDGKYLSDTPKDTPQRLSVNVGFKGLTLNFYSRIVAVDIFGTNGVIHGVDSIIIPPPKVAKIIQFLPGEFSTLELALLKTGLFPALNDTSNHLGGTLFAPSNFAFKKLGPRANAFLFSSYGQKYLKALIKYHVVANQTLYSDAFYSTEAEKTDRPGNTHIELPTLLEGKSLGIDISRFARFVDIRINGFSDVIKLDGVAKDGVIQVVSNVLIPPKTPGSDGFKYLGGEISEEDLIESLEPFVEKEESQSWLEL